MKIRVGKEHWTNRIYFFLVFLAIYCSHDTMLFGTNIVGQFVTVCKAIPFVLIVCLLLTGRLKKVNIGHLMIAVIYIGLPFLSAFFNNEPFDNYIYRAAVMLCSLLFVWTSREGEFYKNFNSVMYFLSIWSLIATILANLVPTVTSIFPTVTNTVGLKSNFLLFSLTSRSNLYGLVRNTCIFREPGVFAVFLAVALMFEMIVMEKSRVKYIVAYSIAMLSTFSTAGYIILAAVYVYMLLTHKTFRYRYLVAILLVAVLLVLSSFTNLLSVESAIWGKFNQSTGNYGSWFARVSGLLGNWRIALQNPLFGLGRYNLYDAILAIDGVYKAVDNTNTIMIGFAAYGILFGLLSVLGVWRFFKSQGKSVATILLGVVILFAALSNEDLGQNILYYYIVFAGIASYTRPRVVMESFENTDKIGINYNC